MFHIWSTARRSVPATLSRLPPYIELTLHIRRRVSKKQTDVRIILTPLKLADCPRVDCIEGELSKATIARCVRINLTDF